MRRPITVVRSSTTLFVDQDQGIPLTWDTVVIDRDGMVQGVPPVDTLYPQRSGWYLVVASIVWDSGNYYGSSGLELYVAGARRLHSMWHSGGPAGHNDGRVLRGLVYANIGDPIQLNQWTNKQYGRTSQVTMNAPSLSLLWWGA